MANPSSTVFGGFGAVVPRAVHSSLLKTKSSPASAHDTPSACTCTVYGGEAGGARGGGLGAQESPPMPSGPAHTVIMSKSGSCALVQPSLHCAR